MKEQILGGLRRLITEVLAVKKPVANIKNSALYDELVQTVIAADDICRGQLNVGNDDINAILPVAVKIRTAIDRLWAKQVIDAEESLIELRNYPYLDDYWLQINRELTLAHLTGAHVDDKSRILIIGDSALPLTTCQILQQTGAWVDELYYDDTDRELASGVARVLGLATHSEFLPSRPDKAELTNDYDLIVVNPDLTNDLIATIANVLPHLRLGGRLLLRSADNARKLLAPVVDMAQLGGLQLLATFQPTDNIINSTLVLRRSNG
ncbi:MAG: nicotianamine synthase family protein [Candidatus Saccharibacteria bacterium]|nr:nicotianamine synthase family protein [Candidatus Saccharibacteria bacterium]